MYEVVINKKTYQHPSRIEEVTLKQWIGFNEPVDETDPNAEIEVLANFSGIPLKELKKAPSSDVLEHIERTKKTISDISQVEAGNTPLKIKIAGRNYFVNQNLDAAPMAQYIDCTHYMKYFGENIAGFYPYMMAIYCLRKDEDYNGEGYDIEVRAEIMRKAMAIDAIRINAFFLTGSKAYAKNSAAYSQGNRLLTK